MQTTLLGLGIAIILALVAAIVGPHYIAWTDYRAAFEQHASTLAGAPVRLAGPIDARLLPIPSLRVRDVVIDTPTGPVRARDAFVEFSLGSLIRGEYRATEVRVSGLELSAGIDAEGRITASLPSPAVGGDTLGIERLRIDDSRIVFNDARAGSQIAIEQFWFGGDVRSLAGPLKGEGGGLANGQRFGYRLALGRASEEATRLRLTVEPVGKPLSADIEGLIKRDKAAYRFDGSASLTQLAIGDASPWKVAGRVKADAVSALFEQLDLEYGAIEQAIKLSGTAEFAFGKSPRLDAVLSARQVDLDRINAQPDQPPRPPVVALRALAEAAQAAFKPPVLVRLGLAIDQLTLAGANVQLLRGDFASDADGWTVSALEFRAPGSTQVRASGQISAADVPSFVGAVSIEAADPRLLAAWLEGRRAQPGLRSGALRASGNVSVSQRHVTIDKLHAEIDRKPIDGRVAWLGLDEARSRFEAHLKGSALDVDAIQALLKATGAEARLPNEIALNLDFGEVSLAGTAMRGAKAKIKLDADALIVEALTIADLAGAVVEGRGEVRSAATAPRGTLSFRLGGARLDGVAALLGSAFPHYADAFKRIAAQAAPARLGVEVAIESPQATKVALRIDGTVGAIRLNANLSASGEVERWREATLDSSGRLESDDPRALARLLGTGDLVALSAGKGLLSWSLKGPAQGDLRTQLNLALPGLTASGQGDLRVTQEGLSVAGDVNLGAADFSALRPITDQPTAPLTFKGRITAGPQRVQLASLTGSFAGSPFSGHLNVLRDLAAVGGRIEIDSLNLTAVLAALSGAPAATGGEVWSAKPFARSFLSGIDATIDIKAKRASLAPAFELRELQGRLRASDASVSLEEITGVVAGGTLKAHIAAPASPLGLIAEIRIALNNADASALFPGAGPSPLGGRFSLLLEAKGSGRSAASLIGSATGSGTLSLDRPELVGFDARTFDLLERAPEIETGDAGKISSVVDAALRRAAFRAPRADAALVLSGGQLRLASLLAKGERANLLVGGGIDLARRTLDARLTLYADRDAASPAGRPEVSVLLRGLLAAPHRTLDISALVGWLALRAVDRQAKRLETLEAQRAAAEAALNSLQATRPAVSSPERAPAYRTPAAPDAPDQLPPAASAPRQRSLFDLFGGSR